MASLFSNKYDVEQSINDAMTQTALSYGMLDRSAYAPMTASTALQGDMAGRGIGMMVGGQDPMVAKQTAIDAIMQKYPNPDTPKEMADIANELGKAGFQGLANEVRNVGIELQKTETTLTTPSKDLLNQVNFKLGSSVITDELLDSYLLSKQPLGEDGLPKPFNIGTKAEGGSITQTSYNAKKEAGRKELEAQFKAFRNAISRDKKWTVNEINNMLSNTNLLTSEFKKWAKTQGNERAQWLDKNMVIANPAGGTTVVNPQNIDSSLEDTSQSSGSIVLESLDPEKLNEHTDQAQEILDNKPTSQEHKQMLEDLQEIINTGFFKGNVAIDNLNATQQILYWRLRAEFPDWSSDTAAMNSGAFNDPDTQMWFEEMLSDVGTPQAPDITAMGGQVV
jgi:hypothetical protein